MSALLPWQTSLWQDLVKREYAGGLPHALLLTGSKGIGKHDLALYLAQWLLCQKARLQNMSEPCGQCHSCMLWKAGSHPDFIICHPEEDSRQIRIQDVRKVNDFLIQTPQISLCQVVIISPVEVMNLNAANALLKTLEEPAGESFLILETERFGSVLPTIRSRCQRLVLQAPSSNEAMAWLAQQGFDGDTALQALRLNQQAPLAALEWLKSGAAQVQTQWLEQLSKWNSNAISLQDIASAWAKSELVDTLQWFYTVLCDTVKYRLGVAGEHQALSGEVEHLLAGATVDTAKLITLQNKVQEVLGHLLSGLGNYNKQLLCESLLLEWQELLHSASAQSGDM